jgi:hypothetical protein
MIRGKLQLYVEVNKRLSPKDLILNFYMKNP